MSTHRQARLQVAFRSAAILILCATGYACLESRMAHMDLARTLYLFAVPVTATLLFILVGTVVPTLFAVGRVTFPLNLTLPLVYGVLMMVSTTLWSSGRIPIVRIAVLDEVSSFWLAWRTVASVFVLQVFVLSLVVLLARRRSRLDAPGE